MRSRGQVPDDGISIPTRRGRETRALSLWSTLRLCELMVTWPRASQEEDLPREPDLLAPDLELPVCRV